MWTSRWRQSTTTRMLWHNGFEIKWCCCYCYSYCRCYGCFSRRNVVWLSLVYLTDCENDYNTMHWWNLQSMEKQYDRTTWVITYFFHRESMVASYQDRMQTDGTHYWRASTYESMAKPIHTLPFEHRSNVYPYDGLGLLEGGAKSSFKGLAFFSAAGCTATAFLATKNKSSSPLFRAFTFFKQGIRTMYSQPDIFSFVIAGTMKRTSSWSIAMFAWSGSEVACTPQ